MGIQAGGVRRDAKIDGAPPPGGAGGPPRARPVAVVAGDGPHLSEETRSLLQVRLRAAALVMLLGCVLYFARRLVGLSLDRQFYVPTTAPVEAFRVAVILALAGCVAWLSRGRTRPLLQLRIAEVASFGLVASFMATMQYLAMLQSVRNDDPAMLSLEAKSVVVQIFMLIVVYGMFIPNTWRRAAAVVGPLALTPIAVHAAFALGHPEIAGLARRAASFAQESENLLTLLIGVVLAIFGTHTINALRREAFEARQFGQYQLRDRLGAGGMGEVYLAEHLLLKRPCALKLIRPDRAADPTALARFEREVRTTAQLRHPNTVEIYDYGHTADGTFYYVMEHLRGLTLDALVERHGPLPAGRAIYLLRQACEALAEAHAAGLIHRDLKPANIFAARFGGRCDVAKLLDFGLVKPIAEPDAAGLTGEGRICGTPLFMSPEQAAGDRAPDARSDLYSLGAVAYYLLAGRALFEGRSPMGVLIALARDPVVPPSLIRPDLPADLERVVVRCLAKRPDDRYPDAEALARALASCSAAADWDARRAAQWWREIEPVEAEATAG
jgi:eukaryotic-like serine/threonine-protein kinase